MICDVPFRIFPEQFLQQYRHKNLLQAESAPFGRQWDQCQRHSCWSCLLFAAHCFYWCVKLHTLSLRFVCITNMSIIVFTSHNLTWFSNFTSTNTLKILVLVNRKYHCCTIQYPDGGHMDNKEWQNNGYMTNIFKK